MPDQVEKKYLIDEIEEDNKPSVIWTQVDSNVGNIIGSAKEAWRKSEHPQKREIVKEFDERVKEIMQDGQGNGYDRIMYLACWVYTHIENEEDEDDNNEFEFDDCEDEE